MLHQGIGMPLLAMYYGFLSMFYGFTYMRVRNISMVYEQLVR